MTLRTLLVAALSAVGAWAAPAPSIGTPAGNGFSYFKMPTTLAGPCDLSPGPDGNIWVEDQLVNKIARINTRTGQVTEFDIPYTAPPINVTLPNVGGRTVLACAIQPGADGHMYASNGVRNQLVQINVHTGQIKVLTPPNYNPLGNLQPFNDIYTSPTGLYFTSTTANLISFYEYATGKYKSWTIPTPLSGPLGIFYASDGGVWFMEFFGQKVGRLDPKTGTFKEWAVPPSLLAPAVIRAETEGRYLWFTAAVGNSLGRIDMKTGSLLAIPNDTPGSIPGVDTKDNKGNIWFSTFNVNQLNKYDPSTKNLTHITMPGTLIPTPVSVPYYLDISVTYGTDNAIWFTNELVDRVGRYQL